MIAKKIITLSCLFLVSNFSLYPQQEVVMSIKEGMPLIHVKIPLPKQKMLLISYIK